MPYRGFPYFVTQSASYDSRVDPYASERRSLPNRTHGIRYASAPRRSSCLRTYAPSETVRPTCAASVASEHAASKNVEPRRIFMAVFVMLLVAFASAFIGIAAAHAITGTVDGSGLSLAGIYGGDNETRAESLSTPQTEWEQGSVPALYQDDPQWGDRPYGSGTIGTAGTAPLCLAMVRVDVTGDVETTPIDVASFSQRSGYADAADASPLLTDGATELGLAAREVDANELSIRRELVAGRPVIAAVNAGAFGSGATYVVLSDIDEHGRLVVNDPLSRDRSNRHWSFDEVVSQTSALWSYTASS